MPFKLSMMKNLVFQILLLGNCFSKSKIFGITSKGLFRVLWHGENLYFFLEALQNVIFSIKKKLQISPKRYITQTACVG